MEVYDDGPFLVEDEKIGLHDLDSSYFKHKY